MGADAQKQAAGEAAIRQVRHDTVVGVGTGSTVNHFIDALAGMKHDIRGAVSSSEASTQRLRDHGIQVFDLNEIDVLAVYVDGADEVNRHLQMIKGGGAALTREKIIAAVARESVCIVDDAKRVTALGDFPLPVEVIPMARSYVARELTKLGGRPLYRQGVVTHNGNVILDVHDLRIERPIELEQTINNIAGVVTVGLFAHRPADVLLVGTDQGVETITA